MDGHDICRLLAMRMQTEHHHWNLSLREIIRLLADEPRKPEDSPSGSDELCIHLRTLRSGLSNHIEEEAQGGCLEEAVCRCPRLSHEAQRIEQEHPRLLARLDEIIQVAWHPENSGKLPRLFQEFNEELTALEDAEERVVQYGLNVHCDFYD